MRRWMALLLLLPLCSCQYAGNRWRDLLDPLQLRLVGGFGVSVRATPHLQIGSEIAEKVRLIGREPLVARHSREWGFAPFYHRREIFEPYYEQRHTGSGSAFLDVILVAFQLATAEPKEDTIEREVFFGKIRGRKGGGSLSASQPEGDTFSGYWPSRSEYASDYDRRFYDVGFSMSLLIGLDVAFNPVEFVDLFLGIFTLDISGDDRPPETPPTSHQE